MSVVVLRGGVIGNTRDFGSRYPGSIPGPAALRRALATLGLAQGKHRRGEGW